MPLKVLVLTMVYNAMSPKVSRVAFRQRRVKGVISDDVAGQTGGTAQPVGVGLFSGLAAAQQGGR